MQEVESCSSSLMNLIFKTEKSDRNLEKSRKTYLSLLEKDEEQKRIKNQSMIPRLKLHSDDERSNSSSRFTSSALYMPHLPPKYRRFYDQMQTSCEPLAVQIAIQEEHLCEVAIVAGRGEQNLFKFHIFLNDRGIWSLGQEIPIPALPKRCIAVYGQSLYFVGGEIGEIPDEIKCQNLFIYNMRTEQINIGAPLRIPRCDAGVGLWNDTMYIVGGLNRYNHPLTYVDAYDLIHNAWCLISPMKFARHKPGIIIVKGVLYAIGGNTVHCEWLPLNNSRVWSELPNLPEIFRDLAMTATHYKDWLIAFRNFRPDRVAVLDRVAKEEWDVVRTSGTAPDSVEDSFTYEESCYVLTRNGTLFELQLAELLWHKSVNCPKTMTKVYHIACVNLKNVRREKI
uniref:BACK domain-containing protein n=1 Tax=Strigamia maritima TaxID=126957 RepID=T1J9S3_STRMM